MYNTRNKEKNLITALRVVINFENIMTNYNPEVLEAEPLYISDHSDIKFSQGTP